MDVNMDVNIRGLPRSNNLTRNTIMQCTASAALASHSTKIKVVLVIWMSGMTQLCLSAAGIRRLRADREMIMLDR